LQSKKKITIGAAITVIARLGGALNRKPKEEPGAITLLKGLARFHDILYGLKLARSEISYSETYGFFVGHAQG
jgi:hypothetical protein